MKTFRNLILLLCVVSFTIASKQAIAQSEEFLPFEITEDTLFEMPFFQTPDSYSPNGYVHTPAGHLHMLVIFVGFTCNTTNNGTPGTPEYWAWNDIPNWAKGDVNKLFSKQMLTIGNDKT